MTLTIPREKWNEFLHDLSKRRFGWETKVEVISDEVGDQILSDGLRLSGMTCEEKAGRCQIEVSVGIDAHSHQTHGIADPVAINYLNEEGGYGGVVEFEEANGTKTLVRIINPMPVFVGYTAYKIVAAK